MSAHYLIRSYDHQPLPLPRKRNIDYGRDQDFRIWEVARAATAAPFFFEPFKVSILDRSNEPGIFGEEYLFIDGGLGYTRNPTREGILEIEESTGLNSVGAVVSIGTAGRSTRKKTRTTDPEAIHYDVQELADRDKFSYYRFDDPGALKLSLDEWEPQRSGSATIKVITKAFNVWLKEVGQSSIQECAVELVKRRVYRTHDADLWESYAVEARFQCRFRTCERDQSFRTRRMFREHLRESHNMHERSLETQTQCDESRRVWQYP